MLPKASDAPCVTEEHAMVVGWICGDGPAGWSQGHTLTSPCPSCVQAAATGLPWLLLQHHRSSLHPTALASSLQQTATFFQRAKKGAGGDGSSSSPASSAGAGAGAVSGPGTGPATLSPTALPGGIPSGPGSIPGLDIGDDPVVSSSPASAPSTAASSGSAYAVAQGTK